MTRWLPAWLDRSATLVAACALICYLPAFWWGLPTATAADHVQSWGVDDTAPLGPLAEVHNIVRPSPDRNLGYPLLHDFVAAAAYAPYLAALRLSGGLHAMSATYPFGLTNPVRSLRILTLINHALSVLLGVVVVVAAFDIGLSLMDRRAGLMAALLTLTLYPMFYYARTGNVDVPMLAMLALALAALARALVKGMTVRRAVWVGIWSGLALATKEASVGAVLPAGLIVLIRGRREGGWKVPALALAASVAALAAGSGLLVDPGRWFAHVRFISGRSQDVTRATTLTSAYAYTLAGNLGLAGAMVRRLVETMTLPGLLLGVAGSVVLAWRDRRAALVALAIPAYLLVTFALLRSAQLRYVLPAAFGLAIFAGLLIALAWRQPPLVRIPVLGLGAIALALQVGYGASLTYEMVLDSRYAAGAWIRAHVQPGERIDFFGAPDKLPPIPPGVPTTVATPFYGMWGVHDTSAAAADAIRRRWSARPPALVLVIPDHSSRPGAPYDASVPPGLYRDLVAGDESYRLAAFFQTPPLLPWLVRPALDYPSVNPPIRIFAPRAGAQVAAPGGAPSS